MSNPFLGEIRIMSFNFAPKGWVMCNGQLLPINQNQALFSLLGTTYGGNGQTTFALPNLQGRVPLHFGQAPGLSNYVIGQAAGEYSHTLNQSEMAAHIHTMSVSNSGALQNATGRSPAGHSPAQAVAATTPVSPVSIYGTGAPSEVFASTAIAPIGGNQPHTNQQPYLVLNCCIALQGIFPSRN
jgi:microcystin-dependent protein